MSRNVATHNTICNIFVDIYYSYVFVDVLTDKAALQYILRRHCDVMYWFDAILTLSRTIFVNYTPDVFFLILLRNLKVTSRMYPLRESTFLLFCQHIVVFFMSASIKL